MGKRNIRLVAATLAVILLLACLLMPAFALARAGGGQVGGGSSGGSSGGGSSGGGSSGSFGGSTSSGSGSSGSLGGLGCCGIIPIIIIVVIVLIVISRAKGSGGTGGGGGTPPAAPPTMPQGDPWAQIKATDPDFNEQVFYGRVNEMFIAIQYAWMNRNMEPVRRFLSDQQFSILNNSVQTDYIAMGRINRLESVHITQMWPVEVTKQGEYDSVKMLIEAACIDYTIDERTKEIINPAELGDGKTPKTFREYWTFLRKSGAQTKADGTIQKCPNCGAPVTDGNYVKCAYCGMQMNDPTLDWVLNTIEQV